DSASPELYALSLHDALPIFEVNLWLAGHMAAQAQLSVFRHKTNTGTLCLQRRQHFLFVVTNATNDTNTCNHNSTHNHSSCGYRRSEEHTSELQSRENLVCRL